MSNPIIERMNQRYQDAAAYRAQAVTAALLLREQMQQQAAAEALNNPTMRYLQEALAETAKVHNRVNPVVEMALQEKEPEGGFSNAVARGVDSLQQGLYSHLAVLGDRLGLKPLRDFGMEGVWRNQDELETNPAKYAKIEDVNSLGDFTGWAAERVGEQVPVLGTILATAPMGIPGMLGAVGALESGEYLSKDVLEGGPSAADYGTSLGVGAVNAALETVASPVGRVLGGLTGTRAAARGLLQQTPSSLLKGGAKGATGEAITEGLQASTGQVADRLRSGDFTGLSQDEISELVNSAAAGALLGGPFGAYGTRVKNKQLKQAQTNLRKAQEDFKEASRKQMEQDLYKLAKEGNKTSLDDTDFSPASSSDFDTNVDNDFLNRFAPTVAPFDKNVDNDFLQQAVPVSGVAEVPTQTTQSDFTGESVDNNYLDNFTAFNTLFESNVDNDFLNQAGVRDERNDWLIKGKNDNERRFSPQVEQLKQHITQLRQDLAGATKAALEFPNITRVGDTRKQQALSLKRRIETQITQAGAKLAKIEQEWKEADKQTKTWAENLQRKEKEHLEKKKQGLLDWAIDKPNSFFETLTAAKEIAPQINGLINASANAGLAKHHQLISKIDNIIKASKNLSPQQLLALRDARRKSSKAILTISNLKGKAKKQLGDFLKKQNPNTSEAPFQDTDAVQDAFRAIENTVLELDNLGGSSIGSPAFDTPIRESIKEAKAQTKAFEKAAKERQRVGDGLTRKQRKENQNWQRWLARMDKRSPFPVSFGDWAQDQATVTPSQPKTSTVSTTSAAPVAKPVKKLATAGIPNKPVESAKPKQEKKPEILESFADRRKRLADEDRQKAGKEKPVSKPKITEEEAIARLLSLVESSRKDAADKIAKSEQKELQEIQQEQQERANKTVDTNPPVSDTSFTKEEVAKDKASKEGITYRDEIINGVKVRVQVLPEKKAPANLRAKVDAREYSSNKPSSAVAQEASQAFSTLVRKAGAKFQALKSITKLVAKAPIGQELTLAYVDDSNNIVLIEENIKREAISSGVKLEKLVGAILQHEGLGHIGLRTIFAPKQLETFLTNVRNSMVVTKAWKNLEKLVPGFKELSPIRQAEEFCAYMAENNDRVPVSNWAKLKSLVKSSLSAVKFKATNKYFQSEAPISISDIEYVLSIANKNITNSDRPILKAGITDLMKRSPVGTPDPFDQSILFDEADALKGRVDPGDVLTRAEQELNKPIFEKMISSIKKALDPKYDGSVSEYIKDNFVDSFAPLERMQQDVKKSGGLIDMTSNVFKINQALPNATAHELAQFSAEYVDPINDAINEMVQPGEDAAMAFYRASVYLTSKAAIERQEFAEKNKGWNPKNGSITDVNIAKAKEYVAKYDSPEMRKVLDAVQRLNDYRLNLLEDHHLIENASEVVSNWRNAYQYYMPFKNWEETVQAIDPSYFKHDFRKSLSMSTAQKKVMHEATGREGEAWNGIATAVLQAYDVIIMKNKAQVGRAMLELARNNKEYDGFRIITDKRSKDQDVNPNLQISKKGNILFPKRASVDETGTIRYTRRQNDAELPDNAVTFLDYDGVPVRVEFRDARVAKAFKGANILVPNRVTRVVGNLTSTLGKWITSLNPLFWIRNPIRDIQSAILNLDSVKSELRNLGVVGTGDLASALFEKGVIQSFGKNSVRQALFHYYKNKSLDFSDFDQETQEYMKYLPDFFTYGGSSTYWSQSTYETIHKDHVQALRDKNPNTRVQRGAALARKTTAYMAAISDSLENMTRYIVFKEMVDAIKNNNKSIGYGRYIKNNGDILTEHEILSRAANVALNITVNFSRKGGMAPLLNSYFMFASASIGGSVRALETIFAKDPVTGKRSPKNLAKLVAVSAAGYMAQAMLCRAVMPDDDDGINEYDKIPQYIRQNNYIIPNPGGGYFKIPLPYVFNIPWMAAQVAFDSAYGRMNNIPQESISSSVMEVVASAFDMFSPMGQTSEGANIFVPSIFRPMFQLYANESFSGNPIYPEGNPMISGKIPDHEKYWSTMNKGVIELAKGLYDTFGIDISPESLEHIVNSYTGGVGRIITSAAARVDDFVRGKPFDLPHVVGVGVLYGKVSDSDTAGMYSKIRSELLTQKATLEASKDDATLTSAERARLFEETKVSQMLGKHLSKTQHYLNQIRNHERVVEKNPNLSSKEKYLQLEELKKQKIRHMKDIIRLAREYGLKEI